MSTETIDLLPKTQAEELQIASDYEWLVKELSQYCDRVSVKFFDYGNTYAICAEWLKGGRKERWAVAVEQPGFSVNAEVRANRMTRKEVIRAYTQKRPSWT